jgi:hypothetical protein
MSHALYMTKPFTFLLFFHTFNNIWWQVQFMKLYIMQFYPISSYKILKSDQHHRCSQTQSTDFLQCQRPSITPTFMKIPHKHTHIYISTVMFSESRKESKTFWSCNQHYCKLISSQFLDSAIFILQFWSKNTSSSTSFQNFKQCIS